MISVLAEVIVFVFSPLNILHCRVIVIFRGKVRVDHVCNNRFSAASVSAKC